MTRENGSRLLPVTGWLWCLAIRLALIQVRRLSTSGARLLTDLRRRRVLVGRDRLRGVMMDAWNAVSDAAAETEALRLDLAELLDLPSLPMIPMASTSPFRSGGVKVNDAVRGERAARDEPAGPR